MEDFSDFIFYIIVFAIFFLGPILKKITEKKASNQQGRLHGKERETFSNSDRKRPSLLEGILNEVEDSISKSHVAVRESKQNKKNLKQYSKYDLQYKQRKQQLEPVLEKKEPLFWEKTLKSDIEKEPVGLVAIEGLRAASSVVARDSIVKDKEELFGDLPETTKMVLFNEILLPPRGMRPEIF